MNLYKQSIYIGAVRILANIIMLGSVFLAMRLASRSIAWSSDIVFCATFFGITIPAWILAHFFTRWIRQTWPAKNLTLVELPKSGKQLVQWEVVERKISPLLYRCWH